MDVDRASGQSQLGSLSALSCQNPANTSIFERRGSGLLEIPFSVPQYALLNQLSELLDDYTKRFWPLIRGESNLLFPTRDGTALTATTLGASLSQWSGEYVAEQSARGYGIKGVSSFRTHHFRDLVATQLVKNATVHHAAAALLDSVRMIEKHYARFIPADRLKSAFTVLAPFFIGANERL